MNHRHRKVLAAIFAHPISANIDFHDVRAVFQELGAEIEDRSGARIAVSLKGHTVLFHNANHSVPKEEVVQDPPVPDRLRRQSGAVSGLSPDASLPLLKSAARHAMILWLRTGGAIERLRADTISPAAVRHSISRRPSGE